MSGKLLSQFTVSLITRLPYLNFDLKKTAAIFFLFFGLTFSAANIFAQTGERQINSDPNKVRFVTTDIDNFWRAFDLAAKETDRAKKIEIYQTEYLDKGSAGLRDFLRMRIKSAKDLVEIIERLSRFYASTRPSTLRAQRMEKQMRASFRKFKRIYPNAVFPDVYFLIGNTSTGGTASDKGLLIGTELYGATAATPRNEFPALLKTFLSDVKNDEELERLTTRYLVTALKPIEKVPPIVAHESCHFNQNYSHLFTVLEKSIQEGACDFVAELIAGEPLNPEQKIYGDSREADLWREFQAEMNSADLSKWMYNGLKAIDRPGDLGYYMGYKICRSYYKNARNKQQAVSEILNIKDFPAFLEKSRYREKFAK
jgi:hypothetical protein